MSLDDVVSVTVTLEQASVTQQGFGTPAIVASLPFTGVRTYPSDSALADLVADGVSTSSRAYALASALLGADVKPVQIKMANRPSASWTQITHVTPTSAVNSTVYSLKVKVGSTVTDISFTSDASATIAEICAGLQAAIDAVTGVTATTDSVKVVVTTDAADTVVSIYSPSSLVKIEDKTPDAGMAADLAAIEAIDDDFYGFVIDSPSELEQVAAATWAESRVKLFVQHLSGTRGGDAADTTDTAATMFASAYKNTLAVYHSQQAQCIDARWLGEMITHDPSYGDSWIFKNLSGIEGEKLSGTFLNGLRSKRVNTYENKGGTYRTMGAIVYGPRFIDQTTLVHELTARVQERGFAALLNDLPYSDESGDALCGEVLGELQTHVQRGSLLATPAPVCTHPLVANISSIDKTNRHFPDINFSAQTAGRIHSITIVGKLIV